MMATVDGERDVVAKALYDSAVLRIPEMPDWNDLSSRLKNANRRGAMAAIAALDAYRADAIRAALREVERAAVAYNFNGTNTHFSEWEYARNTLLRLCGIDPTES